MSHDHAPLVGRDYSFAVIAVRCNSDKSIGKRKLEPHTIYYLLEGYNVKSGGKNYEIREEADVLYDDYLVADNMLTPHVIVSAIVGQNGSGKSSLVEFMMRLINNFAAATFGELKASPSSERLHYIEGVKGDLWYERKGIIYRLNVDNDVVKIYQLDNHNNPCVENLIYSSEETSNRDGIIFLRLSDNALNEIYNGFFYTLISNYSIYAYNTRDFSSENDSRHRLDVVRKGNADDDSEGIDPNWLNGIFHKNDGYQIPLVLTPFRHRGDIEINKENDLAKERLISLIVSNENFRIINSHLKVESISLSRKKGKTYGMEYLKKELGMDKITQNGYTLLKNQVVSRWSSLLERDLFHYSYKPYYELAIDYLTCKTIKVAYTYRQHNAPFRKLLNFEDGYCEDLIDEIINSESTDHSHITRKIFQTLAYILGNGYSQVLIENENCFLNPREIERRFKDDYMNLSKTPESNSDVLKCEVALQSMFPPPFLKSRINLHETTDKKKKIVFESLSSGERQIAYAVSSIMYHLENLNSVKSDNSDELRIKYENVFIVLEEVELYFHPQLQQSLVKNILDGIKQMGLDSIKGIHILMVTHSPYVLSDIPKQNVLALETNGLPTEKKLNTFCANIHEMLEDSFFLSDGLQGYFAQWEVGQIMACIKIHKVFQDIEKEPQDPSKAPDESESERMYSMYVDLMKRYPLRSNNKKRKIQKLKHKFNYENFCKDFSIEQLKQRISLIDEPVIRSILEFELNTVIDEDKELREKRVQELLKEVERLRNMK